MTAERISLNEAADILGVCTRTVRRYVAAGELPAERIGTRLIRVRRADVEALLQPVRTTEAS